MRSPLTGQVYIVTRYTDHPPKDGKKGYTIAHTKYDVTDEFNALAVDTGKGHEGESELYRQGVRETRDERNDE